MKDIMKELGEPSEQNVPISDEDLELVRKLLGFSPEDNGQEKEPDGKGDN